VNHYTNTQTGFYPLKIGGGTWEISQTGRLPEDSYFIIVLNLQYVSSLIYNGRRIQFISKPNADFIVAGPDVEVFNT
jgi:hypothetical protein